MAAPTVSATTTLDFFGFSGGGTINVPAGTTDGDILLLVVGGYSGAPATVSGFTSIASTAGVNGTRSMYRVASSEPASYSITYGTDGGAAAMFRITGDTTSVFNFDTELDESSTDTIAKPSPSLLVMFGQSRDNIGHSAYTITHGTSNPTWTELLDISDTAVDQAFFCAYTTTTDTSDITAWSYTESSAANNSAQLIVSLSPQSVTGTHAQLSTAPTFFSSPASVGVTGTHSQLAVSPTLNAPTASATTPTQWVNESSPTTTWVNEQK